MLPEELRRRLQAARAAVGKLVKRSASDPADVLKREAQAAVSALRETMRHFVSDG